MQINNIRTFDSGVSFFFYGVREVLGKDNKFIDFLETVVMVALVADAVMGLMSIGESVIKLGTKVLTKVSKVENVLDLVRDTAKVAKKVGDDIVKGAKGLIKNLDNTVDDVLSLVGGSKRKLAFAGVADDVGDVTSGLRGSDVVGDAFGLDVGQGVGNNVNGTRARDNASSSLRGNSKRIVNATDGAMEPQVQDFIRRFEERYPNRGYQSGHIGQHSNGKAYEIDFETDNVIIEFKEGSGKGLTRQITDRLDPLINPDGKVVIGVTGKRTSRYVQKDVEAIGGLITDDIKLLLDLISP